MNKLIVLFDKNLDYTNCRYRRNLYNFLIDKGCQICAITELIKEKEDLEKMFLNKYNRIPDFIFFGIMVDALATRIAYVNSLKRKYGTKIGVYIDDLHTHHNKIKKCIMVSDILFLSYPYLLEKFYNNKGNRLIFHLYHTSVKNSFFNKLPKKSICLSGAINYFYPAREIMFNLRNKYNITVLEYNKVKLDEYIDKLSEFICCFACVTKENLIVRKIFEIMASGSLLLLFYGDVKTELEKIGFFDGIHYIGCTYDNIEDKIKWILDDNNIEKINKIRFFGYRLVKNRFNRKRLADKMFQYINDILN